MGNQAFDFSSGLGGAVYLNDENITIKNCMISANSSDNIEGSSVYADGEAISRFIGAEYLALLGLQCDP